MKPSFEKKRIASHGKLARFNCRSQTSYATFTDVCVYALYALLLRRLRTGGQSNSGKERRIIYISLVDETFCYSTYVLLSVIINNEKDLSYLKNFNFEKFDSIRILSFIVCIFIENRMHFDYVNCVVCTYRIYYC